MLHSRGDCFLKRMMRNHRAALDSQRHGDLLCELYIFMKCSNQFRRLHQINGCIEKCTLKNKCLREARVLAQAKRAVAISLPDLI